ncbi:MAG: hypothetical protein WCS99_11065 [Limisphaerales bacterium]
MEAPKAFVVELGASWKRWAKHRTDAELGEINSRLHELVEGFGKPHIHAGLGVRRLSENIFEFRMSRGLRVVFVFIKPRTIRLAMCGNHDDVRAWLKEND